MKKVVLSIHRRKTKQMSMNEKFRCQSKTFRSLQKILVKGDGKDLAYASVLCLEVGISTGRYSEKLGMAR